MKLNYILILVLLSLVLFNNCEKNEPSDFDDSINILIDNTKLEFTNIKENSLENKVALIERIGKDNSISSDFIKELLANKIDLFKLDLSKIIRISCFNTEVSILSVPIKYSELRIMAYVYDDIYCFYRVNKKGNKLYYYTFDDQLLSDVEINENDHSVAYNIIEKNHILNNFSNNVFLSQSSKQGYATEIMTKEAEIMTEDCCRQETDYMGCVDCTLGYFHINKWYMQAAFFMYAPEVIGALYGSCIGAGPDARC